MKIPTTTHTIVFAGLLAALIVLPAAVTPVQAQMRTGAAAIEGRVQNEVTGRYLNNARVSVKGTSLRTMTDEFGRYVLANVPSGSGSVMIEVLFSGLETKEVSVSVTSGQRATLDVKMAPAGASAVQMDPYEVASTKITDQQSIAINEQRFAPNLMTVVATGNLADHNDGNIAEFLKFVPGISGNLGQRGDIGGISVRGFPSNYTQITTDGMDEANAPLSGTSRAVSLRATASISNLARVEILKVPTPATGADTMAGSVNLVSRSAFEAPRREFRYTVTLSGEINRGIGDMLGGKKTYSLWDNKKEYFAWPGFSFTFADPVSDKFGYTITGRVHKVGLPTHERGKTYDITPNRMGASIANPLYRGHLDNWWGQMQERVHINSTADYKLTTNSVLSAGVRYFTSGSFNGIYRVRYQAGNSDKPRSGQGTVSGSYGPTFTIGASGRGAVQTLNNTQIRFNQGGAANLRYAFDNGDWKVDLKTSRSEQDFRYRTLPSMGGFRNLTIRASIPVRVEHRNILPILGAQENLVFDSLTEQPIDATTADFWLNNSKVAYGTMLTFDVSDDVSTYNADIRKELNWAAFPLAVQFGGAFKSKERKTWNRNNYFMEYNVGGNQAPLPEFLTPPIAIFPGNDGQRQVVSDPYGAAGFYNNNPDSFTEPTAGRRSRRYRRAEENIRRQEQIKEEVDAYYFMAEARLFENRLNVLAGVRYEKTSVNGAGMLVTPDGVYQKNADGSFVLDGSGKQVRIPEAGTRQTMAELPFTNHRLGMKATRTYNDYYPSVHLTYNWTDKLQSRAAFAKTYGRPNFSLIIPNLTLNESFDGEGADATATGGSLTLRNTGLLPWTADNYDLTTEYYTDQGGVFTAGVFRKNVTNFFVKLERSSTAQELAEAGVDDASLDWETRTTINGGSAELNGVEFSFNQSLAPLDAYLGGWGKYFRLFANYTKIKVTGIDAENFLGFQPRTANWGISYNRKRARVSLRWNSAEARQTRLRPELNPGGFNGTNAYTHLDINASFGILPNLDVFINMKNVFRVVRIQTRFGDNTPDYARNRNHSRYFGVSAVMGISGSF